MEQSAALRETLKTIVAAIQALSDVNLEAIIAYYLQGCSYAELAALTSELVCTVKSRLFKAPAWLRRRFDHVRKANLPATALKWPAMPVPQHLEMQIVVIWEYIVA